jgi:23S rRNA pseudouridine1911/1915/1917 synthase
MHGLESPCYFSLFLSVISVAKQHFLIDISAEKAGERLDLLVQQVVKRSRGDVTGLFDHECVSLNGAVCLKPFLRAKEGDKIELDFDDGREYHAKAKPKKMPPTEMGFDLVYEDDDVIVVNKPAGVLTVPSPYGESNTLVDRITTYLRTQNRRAEGFCAHRLDRGVSGLLVFGKSLEISERLRDQFEERKPKREYIAIVAGNLNRYEGTFRSYLATDANLNRYSTKDPEEGQLAITHFRAIKGLGDATVVQIWLETGRRNQIRVHFAEEGHPVIGDGRYQSQAAAHKRWQLKRIALHARMLGFVHPVTGKAFQFESPLPKEFVAFIQGQVAGDDSSRRRPGGAHRRRHP